MKCIKTFRILAVAIILAVLVVALPATPVMAQATVSINLSSGPVGTTVAVSGTGFAAGNTYSITFAYGTPFAQLIASGTVTNTSFSANFNVPAVPRGHYIIQVITTLGIFTPSFTVVPQITLSSSSGYIGDTVTVSGTGFEAKSSVTIHFNGTDTGSAVTTTDNGTFSGVSFTISESSGGTHTVKGSDASGYSPGISFTILPRVTVNPTSGIVGEQITIRGNGFAASSEITFYFDSIRVSTDATTDGKGSFIDSNLTIPNSSAGTHNIKAQDDSDNDATISFTIGQKIIISPSSGPPGSTVTFTGTGFRANKAITIKYNSMVVTTSPVAINADNNGGFNGSFKVPALPAGTYQVVASDGTYSSSDDFVCSTETTISQTTSAESPGYVGMSFTITGTGFKPNARVTITYTTDPVVLATVTTDKTGTFSIIVTIPPSVGGNHIITVTDGYTTKQVLFVMESEAPPVPVPLLPETETKAEGQTYFDWEDVTDPSGVTYTLQVATDAAFTSLVLKKKGLTVSDYTITEEEKLKSVKKKEPYYWRVRALDGASNESEWSTPRPFWVGILFIMHDWALYVLIVSGALLCGVIGYLLAKRKYQYH